MKEVKEYMVVHENNINSLETSVNKAIALYWQLHEGLIIHTSSAGVVTFAQVMVKYK